MRNPIQRTAQLQPVANPVDTYVQPAKSPLRDVADALGPLNKNLQEYMAVRQEKLDKEAAIRGRVAGFKATPEEAAQATREGKIPGQDNPNFMAGYKRSQGELAGGQLQAKFNAAFEAWDGKNSEDPTSYDKFVQEFLRSNLGSDDPDILTGTVPYVNQLITNGRAQYIAYRNDQVQKGALDTHVGVASQMIRQANDAGISSEKGTDYELVNKAIDQQRINYISSGGDPAKFDKSMMEAMSGLALETQDPKLLDWFDRKGVNGIAPRDTPDGLAIKNRTMSQLHTIAGEQVTQQAAREERQRKANLLQAQVGIMDSLVKNRDAPVPEELLKAAEKNGDYDVRTKIAKWREDLNKGDSDPQKLNALYAEIVANPNVDPMVVVRRGLEAGVFQSYEDMSKATTFAQSFKDNGDKINRVFGRNSFNTALKVIADRTTELNDMGNPVTGISDDALAAQYDFRQLMTQWLIDNPNATDQDIEKRINEVQSSILGNIKVNPDASTLGNKTPPGQYTRDPNLGFPNAADVPKLSPEDSATQGIPQESSPPAPPAGQQKAQATGGPSPDQVNKWIAQQKPEYLNNLKQGLSKKGITLEDFTKQYLTANPQLRPISYNPADEDNGAGDTRGKSFTPEQGEGMITQALQGAKAMGFAAGDSTNTGNNLLNLVGQLESGGNYNAVFGASNSQIDLSQFTVDDILARQQWARQAGYKSTAIGAYQFLYDTINSLKAEGVVKGNEPFDKATQDKMGYALLNRRGLNDFLNGTISKRQFALRLSQEWAALPNPNTGKSYYAGDGLNASRAPASAVYNAMGLNATPISYGNEGSDMGLRFVHPEQRAGVKKQLTTAIAGAYADLGINDPTVLSGFRSANHPAERGKGNGGGEHTHGNASDVSLKGLNDQQRAMLVRNLMARGVKRFITYSNTPDMLHIDLKDQTGNGTPYFMHNKSAKNMSKAPQWFRDIAFGATI